jgi:proteasome lid subunit RPN8/RPN11
MIRIEPAAWEVMVAHAKASFPNECCGTVFGVVDGDTKAGRLAIPMENIYQGSQADRYEIRPQDLLKADLEARKQGLDLIAIFHSHPDCDAYFSETDLKNSSSWYSFIVLSIRDGEFSHAKSFLPNPEQTEAPQEKLVY